MKRLAILAVLVAALMAVALPAGAVVDEQVGAWCGNPAKTAPNGGLAPPGISGGSNADNFAQPVRANGVVVLGAGGPEIGDSPAAKFPAGTEVPGGISAASLDHPLTNCKKLNP